MKLDTTKGRLTAAQGTARCDRGDGAIEGSLALVRSFVPRRRHYVALLVVAGLAISQAGCGSGGDASAGASDQVGSPPPRFARLVELSSCPAKTLPHGGGSDVRARGLSCEQVGRLLPSLGLPIGRNDPKSAIFDRGNGWTCWAQFLGRNGPVQNLCWLEERILVYKYE